MKYKEISFQILLDAIRHHWKAFLLTVVLSAMFGAACGIWYAPRGTVSSGWEVQSLDQVDFTRIRKDEEYYWNCNKMLSATYSSAEQYLIALSDDSTTTAEQQEAINELWRHLRILQEEDYQPVQEALLFSGKQYLPKAARKAQYEAYNAKLASARQSLPQAEAAAELIRNMDAPDVGSDSILSTYGDLLKQAEKYTQLQQEIPFYEEMLRQLKEEVAMLDENCRKMDSLLETAADNLNRFLSDLTEAAESIAMENNLRLSVEYRPDITDIENLRLSVEYGSNITDAAEIATVTLSHTHRASSGEESFAVMTLFCTLVGICGGAFFIVCRELYGRGKQKS